MHLSEGMLWLYHFKLLLILLEKTGRKLRLISTNPFEIMTKLAHYKGSKF